METKFVAYSSDTQFCKGAIIAKKLLDPKHFDELMTLERIEERNLLYGAIEECNLELVEYCLKRGANPNRYVFAWTPLYLAGVRDFIDAIKLLLDYGADIHTGEIFNSVSFSVLSRAILFSKLDIAKILIDRGANIETSKLNITKILIDHEANSETIKKFNAQYKMLCRYVCSRNDLRKCAIYLIAMHQRKLQTLTRGQDVNVLRLIGKHIWSNRLLI